MRSYHEGGGGNKSPYFIAATVSFALSPSFFRMDRTSSYYGIVIQISVFLILLFFFDAENWSKNSDFHSLG